MWNVVTLTPTAVHSHFRIVGSGCVFSYCLHSRGSCVEFETSFWGERWTISPERSSRGAWAGRGRFYHVMSYEINILRAPFLTLSWSPRNARVNTQIHPTLTGPFGNLSLTCPIEIIMIGLSFHFCSGCCNLEGWTYGRDPETISTMRMTSRCYLFAMQVSTGVQYPWIQREDLGYVWPACNSIEKWYEISEWLTAEKICIPLFMFLLNPILPSFHNSRDFPSNSPSKSSIFPPYTPSTSALIKNSTNTPTYISPLAALAVFFSCWSLSSMLGYEAMNTI